ncbi:hypothetical protein M8C21_025945 [Ambrosia artemisiifolia]|uniref:Uncharacterized protein n=1 Tax=Ambrosia artemisiifolia TaxID=4212 RepID=A0AAD5CYV1_AMBAR|nr:hypothetical protein M8C21_025945 [Ambrosia artemisiifolia]
MPIFKTVPSKIKDICLIISSLSIFYLLSHPLTPLTPSVPSVTTVITPPPLTSRHVLFSIASSSKSYINRKPYLHLWYNPNSTNAITFLDRPISHVTNPNPNLPPIIISSDTSHFPYTFPKGLRSAIRVARIVKEAVDYVTVTESLKDNIRWYVFGDDDTVFVRENVVRVLSKYDDKKWYYIGGRSESYDQNMQHSFNMAFGGGGFAISGSLGRVLGRVLDSCLRRYPHVYGSDSRVYSCLVELGVELTYEPGFHQVDVRGDLFGILAAHPLSPLLSLHHFDIIDPIFPGLTKQESVKHLFKAVNHDPPRILQQAVCYDSSKSITISVSWGYVVQVFEGNQLLPDLIRVQKTFTSWRRKETSFSRLHMFDMRDYSKDPCKSPDLFFFEGIVPEEKRSHTFYTRKKSMNCSRSEGIRNLVNIKVFSRKIDADTQQISPPRRECCEILQPYNETMVIALRRCEIDELIAMDP